MPPKSFTHRIELETHEYTQLLQIVMKYGTSTGEGVSTPVSLRKRLADAQIIHHEPYQGPRFPEPVPVVIEDPHP